MFASQIGRPSTSGPGQRVSTSSFRPIVQERQRTASALPIEGSTIFKAKGKRSKRRKVTQDDDTARVTTAQSLAEHLTQGDEFLSKKRTRQKTSSLVGAALLRSSMDLYRLVPPTLELPNELKLSLHDLPPHLAERLLQLLIDQVNFSNKARMAPLILALIQPSSTTNFSLPLSVSRDFALSRELIIKLMSCSLTTLDLSGQMELKDSGVIPIIRASPRLQKLVLRSCLHVGDETARTVASHCPELQILNLNFSSVTHKGLAEVIGNCDELQTLKLASMNGLTDQHVTEMLSTAQDLALSRGQLPLGSLRSLKLKRSGISDVSLNRILAVVAPGLESLDVSFTPLRTLDFLIASFFSKPLISSCRLRKLNLSGLTLKFGTLKKLFQSIAEAPPSVSLPLEKLKVGSIGATLLATAGSNDYFDSKMLANLQMALLRCPNLISLSLFGNERICNSTGYLGPLLMDLSPKLTFLDLSNTILANSTTSRLRMADLAGLVEDDDGILQAPKIETLLLDGTKVDDEAIRVLQHCKELRSLHLANSTVTPAGLSVLLEHCPKLTVLNLSGCRGIPTKMRRNAFNAIFETSDSESEAEPLARKTQIKTQRARRIPAERSWGSAREYVSEEDSDFELSA